MEHSKSKAAQSEESTPDFTASQAKPQTPAQTCGLGFRGLGFRGLGVEGFRV